MNRAKQTTDRRDACPTTEGSGSLLIHSPSPLPCIVDKSLYGAGPLPPRESEVEEWLNFFREERGEKDGFDESNTYTKK
jgi:hypothetical protein